MNNEPKPNIPKTAVLELLKSLHRLHDLPRQGLDLAQTLAANAQRAQLEAVNRFNVVLSNDAEGIKTLSRLLSSMHDVMTPSRLGSLFGAKISLRDSVLIANTFGAFLGEVMRHALGGEWRTIEFQNQKLVALWFGERDWSLPTYKAGKHFMNGEEDDVMFFYEVFMNKRAGGGMKDALVITTADIAKGREHIAQLVARHEGEKTRKKN